MPQTRFRLVESIGAGPFRLDKYVPNDRVEMVAFQDYWDPGKPYLERYIARQIPDVSSMTINLESGAVDAIWQPTPTDLQRLKRAGRFKVGVASKFEPAGYDQLRSDLQSTLDHEKRKQICRKIQELALDECFNIPAAPNQRGFAYAPYVRGFSYNLDYSPNAGDFWLEK